MVQIFPTAQEMAQAAARDASATLQRLLAGQDTVRLLAATGASQLDFLARLTSTTDIDWSRIELFHLDEYAGLDETHAASFARYIRERLIVPTGIPHYHLLDGMRDPQAMAQEAGDAITSSPIDLAFVGIGENGHLAFNDPPADFDIEDPYLVVTLDEACRQQQVGEGWFAALEDVPKQAISLSIRQLLQSREILCVVPDRRKADAVQRCLEGPVSPMAPASVLRVHPNTTIYLDAESASLLNTSSVS